MKQTILLTLLFLVGLHINAQNNTTSSQSTGRGESARVEAEYEKLVEKGISAVKADSLAKAEDLFRQALHLSPKDYRNPLLYGNLAKVQIAMGQKERALTSYDLALNFVPKNVPLLMGRAGLYLEMGNLSKALIDYRNVIEVDPNNVEALQYLGFIFTQQREYAKAKTHYERLLTIEPDNYAAQLGVAILFQEVGKPGDAIARLTQLADKYPDKAEIFSMRAEIEAESKQLELALIDLDKAIMLEPTNKNMILTRAYIYLEQGNKSKAKKDFERAIELGVPRGQLKEELKMCK